MQGLKIGVVGVGRLGGNLAIWLKRSGFNLSGVLDIDSDKAEKIARLSASARFKNLEQVVNKVNLLFISVPDDKLPSLSDELYSLMPFRSRFLVHTSGIYSSAILYFPEEKISAVSLHPTKAFSSVNTKRNPFKDTIFITDGDKVALRITERIANALGASLIKVNIKSRGMYHAGCCFLTNLLTANFLAGVKLLEDSGIEPETVREISWNLISSAVKNFISSGSISAITGPVARGDLSTLERHRLALKGKPEAKLYDCLTDYLSKLLEGKRK